MIMLCSLQPVHWTAPEMLRGEPYDLSLDIFSYGIILWELITRRSPYERYQGNPVAVALHVSKGERPPIPLCAPQNIQLLLLACFEDVWNHDSDHYGTDDDTDPNKSSHCKSAGRILEEPTSNTPTYAESAHSANTVMMMMIMVYCCFTFVDMCYSFKLHS